MNKPVILVIDDEAPIRRLLQIILEGSEYGVLQAATGQEGILLAASHRPELIILDVNLPDLSGQAVLSELRQWYHRPVIMLSVLNAENDIVSALDNGATDYLSKPFRTGELLARIRACLRHFPGSQHNDQLSFGSLTIDLSSRSVRKNDHPVKLTGTEYQLLALFAVNHGRVLTHHYLLKEVWGTAFQTQTQYLRVFIGQLRKKIEDNPDRPALLITENGIGYRFGQ